MSNQLKMRLELQYMIHAPPTFANIANARLPHTLEKIAISAKTGNHAPVIMEAAAAIAVMLSIFLYYRSQ